MTSGNVALPDATGASFPARYPPNARMQALWQKGLAALRPTPAQLERGLALHRECLVCDGFGFLPMVWSPELFETLNAAREAGAGIREWRALGELERMRTPARDAAAAREFLAALQAAGVHAIVQNVGGEGAPEVSLPNMAARARAGRVFARHLRQAGTAEDIRAARASGRTAIVWSVNGPPGNPRDPDDMLRWLQVWHDLGVRLMHLTYNRRNAIAGGCTEETDDGLSDFGREYVRAMNRVGVIVDTPHSSPRTVLDAARVSSQPIMASHIGVRRLFEHPRCKRDDELKAIAGTGGLIGIYAIPSLLGPGATLATLLDHVDAAVRVIGVEHVGIATDNNYVPGVWPPPGVQPHPAMAHYANPAAGWKPEHMKLSSQEHIEGSLAWTNWPLITVGLVMRGYADDAIRAMLGENLLRVLAANRPPQEVGPDP